MRYAKQHTNGYTLAMSAILRFMFTGLITIAISACGGDSGTQSQQAELPVFQFRVVVPNEFSKLADTSGIIGSASFDNSVDPEKTCLLSIGSNNISRCDFDEALTGMHNIVITWSYDDIDSGLLPLASFEKSVLIDSSVAELTTANYDSTGFQYDVDGDGASNLSELIASRDPFVFEYVSLTGTWTGTYHWDCDGRTGSADISLQLVDDDIGGLSGQLSYIGVSETVAITGNRFGEVKWDPWGFSYSVISASGVYFRVSVPEGNNYVANNYSGYIQGDATLSAITLNGDSGSGCSAASTASGNVSLQKNQ